MLLAIDIGNTNITVGVFKFDHGRPMTTPARTWRLATDRSKTADEYGTKILDMFHYALLDASEVKGVAIANVVPILNRTFADMSAKYFRKEPYFVTADSQQLMPVLYNNPSEVGADRIANAIAASVFFGTPNIVIDFGTATTFDCVSKNGEYLGGVIAPGPAIAAESLSRRTAKLPLVEMVRPTKAIATTTIDSIQAGLYYGYIGLIREILKKVKKEISGTPYILATGGLASLIVPEIKEVKKVVDELTLEGIRILWEKSK